VTLTHVYPPCIVLSMRRLAESSLHLYIVRACTATAVIGF